MTMPKNSPNKISKTESKEEFIQMIDGMMNNYYTIQVSVCANSTGDMMSYHFLNQGLYKTYKHVKLVNVNGMGTGQVHFVTDDGSYLLLPWCYIIAMFPEEKEKTNVENL